MTIHANDVGMLYTTTDTPPVGGINMASGMSYADDGSLHITSVKPSPVYFNAGLSVSKDGAVYVASSGIAVNFVAGFPVNSDGALITSATTPSVSAPFIKGVAVGTAGVHITDGSTPPLDTNRLLESMIVRLLESGSNRKLETV